MRRIIPRMSEPRLIKPESAQPSKTKPKLLHQVRAVLRTRHLSMRTEQAYVQWTDLIATVRPLFERLIEVKKISFLLERNVCARAGSDRDKSGRRIQLARSR